MYFLALLCGLAAAAPHPPPAPAPAPASHSHGTLQALKYNYLSATNNGTSAVLVHDHLSNRDAHERCAGIGERLYPFTTAPAANRSELAYQLDYLGYEGDLHDDVWIGGHRRDCLAYSHRAKRVLNVQCDRRLPALCTADVPPTTDVDRNVVASSQITVRAKNYTLTGYRDARSFRFLGVPFADPPVGELRLAPPRKYSGPKKVNATALGDSCIQSLSDDAAEFRISEDCLYLNVFTPILPGQPGAVRKPVAVYFYGGAFTSGTTSSIDIDGGNFASRNDVVVVTVNYRLGALGFLATGNLTTGSYGTRDQILALEWVQEHIAAFGGDPKHVTIFGQSAGGQSVIALLSSSAARGLFSGALIQSAPVDLPWYTREVYTSLVTPHVAEAVGCSNTTSEASLLSCLRTVPARSYLDNSTAFEDATSAIAKVVASDFLHVSTFLSSIEPIMPMVDDTNSGVIDDQFYTLLANNRLPNRVPTMFTTVSDEAAVFVSGAIPSLGSGQLALDTLLGIAYPPKLAAALIAASAFSTDLLQEDAVRIQGGLAFTASEWTCPQAYLLRNSGGRNGSFPILYEVEITDGHADSNTTAEICLPNDVYNATCHSNDILPAWGTLNSKTQDVQPYYGVKDLHHSQMLNDIFGAFFRTRNPNPDPEVLRIRGPAYASTLKVFGNSTTGQGYKIEPYRTGEKSLALLGMPPSKTQNPGDSVQCKVFEEFGFTFENALLT
ncbi:alpha/beta-hydrolase [Aspergillus unguis]